MSKVAVIGLGLIGSSIARAAKKNLPASSIVGADNNAASLAYALQNKIIDQAETQAANAVADADIVIIATPTPLLEEIGKTIAPALKHGALVMDTGSVKRAPLAIMTASLPAHALIVPAHPIAGSEQSGVTAGREDLLQNKRIIITPATPLSTEELQRVNAFWKALGGKLEAMPAEMHDVIYGYVSHLPQLLAFAAKDIVGENTNLTQFLRIAHSDRALWQDIFTANADMIATALDRYLDAISHIHRELQSAPRDAEITPGNADSSALFARIAASCLATTVMEAEKKTGVAFAKFAGTGFADFISPATNAPEQDLEHISNNYAALIPMLASYEKALLNLRKTLE